MARPTREDLIAELDDIKQRALNAVRVWYSKEGDAVEYPQADFKACIECIRLKGELCGYLGNARGSEGVDAAETAIERRLNALRRRAA